MIMIKREHVWYIVAGISFIWATQDLSWVRFFGALFSGMAIGICGVIGRIDFKK